MFPALDPIRLRQTKAREVLLLFKRADKLNARMDKEKENKENKEDSVKMVDVTGQPGWF